VQGFALLKYDDESVALVTALLKPLTDRRVTAAASGVESKGDSKVGACCSVCCGHRG
jgi:hypothetical protein